MAKKDKIPNAEQEGTEGIKEPSQSAAEFYSLKNAPIVGEFTSGGEGRDPRQEHEDEQADARDGGGSGFQGASGTEVPEASEAGASLLSPSDPQAGRLGDRLDALGLLPDHASPNVLDDAADAGGGSGGYAGMGKEGLIGQKEATGGPGYAVGYDSQEGLRSTGAKPSGDGLVYDAAETLSTPFIPGQGSGPTNEELRRLEQEESGGTEGGTAGSGTGSVNPPPPSNPPSYTRKNPDGTVDVVKGDTMFHWDPATNTVTERNTATGEKTTTSPNDSPGLFGIPADENEGSLPPGFIDDDALLPPELRTESILQNMTGVGRKGGEEVNPAREGGTSGGAAVDDPFRQTKEEMIGQPDPDAAQHGGRSPGSEPTFGPGQEEINPGEDGSLPPGETRSEDLPGGATSSQDDSLGLEGGHDGEFDFSGAAEQIQDAQKPPQLPPGYEYDTTDESELLGPVEQAPNLPDYALLPPDKPIGEVMGDPPKTYNPPAPEPRLASEAEPMQTLDAALFDPSAPGPTLDPALFDPSAPGPSVDAALFNPVAPGPTLDPALLDPVAPGPTLDPALLAPNTPGPTVDPSLLDASAPGETIDPALLDPAAPGPTVDPALLEQGGIHPGSGVAQLPADVTSQPFTDPSLMEPPPPEPATPVQNFDDPLGL